MSNLTAVFLLSLSLIALALAPAAFASTLEYNFKQGNNFYTDGEYRKAIGEYEKVIQGGYQSAELYYNLGNAYFREGMLGQAIKNYIRAKRLNPHDEDIRANLEFARQFTIDKIEISQETIFFQYINRFFDSFSLIEITWIALILYILVMAVVLGRYIYRWWRVSSPIFVVLLVLFIISAALTGVKFDRDVLTRGGVVISQQTDIKNGPGEDYNTQFMAHSGLTFKIDREESGYYLVDFENRLKGWIKIQAVAEI
ncbi:MAG: tetratricopeptide repeat protein [candidate division Zixibacteria bacterium]